MKKLFLFCSIILLSLIIQGQNSYTLYSLTIIQNDSIVYKDSCLHSLTVNDSIFRLTQGESNMDFYTIDNPDQDGWQYVRSFAKLNKPSYLFNLKIAYFDEYLKNELLWKVHGKDRVLYSIIIETNETSASNNIRYTYTAYENN